MGERRIPVPVRPREQAGIAFPPHVESDVLRDALEGTGAHQVIERRQTGRPIRAVHEGEILGVTVRVARQNIEDLPSKQMPRVEGGLAGGLPHG